MITTEKKNTVCQVCDLTTSIVLEITRAVPSHVLLSWGCVPAVTAHSSSDGDVQHHGVASRELNSSCAQYHTGRAAVWCNPPPPINYEPWRFHEQNFNSCFSRAAKSSAISKIEACMRNQQAGNFSTIERKRKRGKKITQQITGTSLLAAAAETEYERSSDRCSSISSESSDSSSLEQSSLSSLQSPPLSPAGSGDSSVIRDFSIKVPKLEVSDLKLLKP